MTNYLPEPLLYVAVTVVLYAVAARLYRRWTIIPLNPLILVPAIIIALIQLTGISYDTYNSGGKMITFLLGPATVGLGVPLYKKMPVIKKVLAQAIISITIGATVGLLSVVLFLRWFGAGNVTQLSLAAKSTTMPIAIGITEKLGGLTNLIVLGVVFAGIFGGMAGPEILRLFRVKNPISVGLAIGTASHAGGTSRAIQVGETEGSMSGSAIVLTGLVTALMAPFVVPWLIK